MIGRLHGWFAELRPMRPHLVWLAFLLIPAAVLAAGSTPWWATALGWLSLVLHAVLFIITMHAIARAYDPGLGSARTPHTDWRVAGPVLVLQLAATAMAVPALDVGAAPLLSFAMATLIFLTPRAWSYALGVLIPIAVTLAVVLRADLSFIWAWGPTLWTALVMLISRASVGGELRAERLRTDLARSETREQVASDVHDLLGHSLSLITVKGELAKRLVHTDPDRALAELDAICDLSRTATSEVRSTVRQLSAPDLAHQLELSVDGLRASGLAVRVTGQVDDIAPENQRLAAWVLREASTNVVRHAAAAHCTIALSPTGVTIRDDGRGLSDGADPGRGHGLRSMRTRSDAQGAHLTIAHADPGTVVSLEFA